MPKVLIICKLNEASQKSTLAMLFSAFLAKA